MENIIYCGNRDIENGCRGFKGQYCFHHRQGKCFIVGVATKTRTIDLQPLHQEISVSEGEKLIIFLKRGLKW